MLNSIFTGTISQTSILPYIICTLVSLVLGVAIGLIHMYRNSYSKNFILTLAIMPAIVQAVILLVNGNLGTGVAVMGAFSLVRFRSVPGNSREITSIFLAMAVGLATGTGYIGIALAMVLCVGGAMLLMVTLHFGDSKKTARDLKITVPENLEYEGLFDELLNEFTTDYKLLRVKTASMGSMYELHYQVSLAEQGTLKAFMDAIRCRNGNLPVVCNYVKEDREEL